jgi:hypothetical protein
MRSPLPARLSKSASSLRDHASAQYSLRVLRRHPRRPVAGGGLSHSTGHRLRVSEMRPPISLGRESAAASDAIPALINTVVSRFVLAARSVFDIHLVAAAKRVNWRRNMGLGCSSRLHWPRTAELLRRVAEKYEQDAYAEERGQRQPSSGATYLRMLSST